MHAYLVGLILAGLYREFFVLLAKVAIRHPTNTVCGVIEDPVTVIHLLYGVKQSDSQTDFITKHHPTKQSIRQPCRICFGNTAIGLPPPSFDVS
jgi:hypothetical protein